MKRLIILAVAAVAVMFTAAPVASAAPIRECGNMGYWVKNITTRKLSCKQARSYVKHTLGHTWGYNNAGTERRAGWACYHRPLPDYVIDIRCTVGNLGFDPVVIRFQYQSGE